MNSPLVMIVTVSQRVVLATHIHHDVTRSQFFGVPSPHNLCILQTQKGGAVRQESEDEGWVSRGVVLRLVFLALHTLYSGRRRSNAQARASSQWKVPLCVPIRGGAMRLLRGLLGGETDSEPSMRRWVWRSDRSGSNTVRISRRKQPIGFPPLEG